MGRLDGPALGARLVDLAGGGRPGVKAHEWQRRLSWHPAIDWRAEHLAAMPVVTSVVLFGSRARGDARERSDIDLAVEAPGASPQEWSDVAETVDEAPALLPIDLVRLEEADEGFRVQILREGVTLLERGRGAGNGEP